MSTTEHLRSHPVPGERSASTPDPFDTPLFNRLIDIIEKQCAATQEQKSALEEQRHTMNAMKKIMQDHGEQMKILTRDVLKGPYGSSEKLACVKLT